MTATAKQINIKIFPEFEFLLSTHYRHKVLYGGRGGGKSENIARALIALSLKPTILFKKNAIRILCAREIQGSIKNSVHKLLVDIIRKYKLHNLFKITEEYIKTINGSEFIFKGIKQDPTQIKSMANIDLCWVEEAETVSKNSWQLLLNTIRADNSEIWVSFNPKTYENPAYQMFIVNPRPSTKAVKVNYDINPYFLKSPLYEQMLKDKQDDYSWYLHIWEGEILKISNAVIFKDKFIVDDFDFTSDRYYYGIDWGFSSSPLAVVRCFEKDNNLYVDYEAGGLGIEYSQMPMIFDSIPDIKKWVIYADSSRPESIKEVQKMGYKVYPCKKGSGSVEDGIQMLKSFNKIIIHPRCKQTAKEFANYSYKLDNNGNPLPIIIKQHDHYIDALRYSMDGRGYRQLYVI